jgi:hypothetical protein
MPDRNKITALRMERQHLSRRADETAYIGLYRDLQPGQNVYWNGFGDPPSLTYRADFNDMEFNRRRQSAHELVKGRFGGILGWIMVRDMELFGCLFRRSAVRATPLLELIERQGPLTIRQMKEETGMLVKEITPVLHRLQEAFLIYEDQDEGQEDRGWCAFGEMFPEVDLERYTREEALAILLRRFAFRHVEFTADMIKSYYRLPVKLIKTVLEQHSEGFVQRDGAYMLESDYELLKSYGGEITPSVFAMHRADFLVKSHEHILKTQYPHQWPDTLYYLLIDGEFRGVAAGKFRYTTEVDDVIVDLPPEKASARRDEILRAVHALCGENNRIKRYRGVELS